MEIGTVEDPPKRDAEAPDRFHFVTDALARPDPIAVDNVSPVTVQLIFELIAELIGRLRNAGGPDHLAVQVGEWFTDDGGHDDKSDEHHTVQASVDEMRKTAIDVED